MSAAAARAAGPGRWYAVLKVSAVLALVVPLTLVLPQAGRTFGYDFQAYLDAARRLIDGRPLYDLTVSAAGGFAIYLYPPPFALAILPLALLPGAEAPTVAWITLTIAALVAAIALLPVRPWVRWTVLLVAGLSFPVIYAVKLGQVGPLLLLLFALAWRSLDRPVALGLAIAGGTLVKLQPALLVPWALVVGRWRAAAIAIVAVAGASLASAALLGPGTWADYVALLRRVSDPIGTPHTVSPGAIAYQLGASEGLAWALQWAAVAAVAAVMVHAWFRRDPASSLVVTAVVSQCLSPVLWDHYAVVLLLPVALVLERRGPRAWPIALLPIAGWLPLPFYPALFGIGLIAAWGVGTRVQGRPPVRDGSPR